MFTVVFNRSAGADLRYLKKADQNVILDAVAQQLAHDPLIPTRNRKALRPNNLASWELRVGDFRVFYDVDDRNSEVTVKAVGWKEHNKYFIRGREFTL
jgi:mRNA-degrading endonuclease RelE of RelBE toxin-antitoxin system